MERAQRRVRVRGCSLRACPRGSKESLSLKFGGRAGVRIVTETRRKIEEKRSIIGGSAGRKLG